MIQLAQDCRWLQRGENLLIFEPSGVRKTNLASAVGRSVIELGQRVKFTCTTFLVQQLLQALSRFTITPFSYQT